MKFIILNKSLKGTVCDMNDLVVLAALSERNMRTTQKLNFYSFYEVYTRRETNCLLMNLKIL